MTLLAGSTPLDDFPADAGSSSAEGEALQKVGVLFGAVGTIVAAGALIFAAAVLRGRASDRTLVLRLAAVAGVVAAAGGAIEVAGVASILDVGWDDALGDRLGSSGMMRLVGGLLLAVGLHESIGRYRSEEPGVWRMEASAFFSLAGAAFAVLSFGFDGHTTTEGPRVLHAVVNAVHVGAAAVWAGGLLALAIVALRGGLRGAGAITLHRFGAAATAAIVVVGVGGIVMSWWVLDGFGELTSTPWGRLLLAKTSLAAIAGVIGAHHHFRVLPAFESDGAADSAAHRGVTRSLAVEAAVLAAAAVVSGFLATASTV